MVKVSVIVKALNEESNISRSIESALKAVAPYGGEVILADGGSTDRTIERAMMFPITIVQLERPNERCCGIGPQLGYQYSRGDYVYVLDGDMELNAAFLGRAIELLDREHSVAGVGGFVREMRTDNLEFHSRVRRQRRRQQKLSDVHALAGGGLYRRAAVEQVEYLSDRNLHGYEEYDLGARLRAAGWRLIRLDDLAADHYSYAMKTWQLLWHRICAGYMLSAGELLRASIGKHFSKNALLELQGLRIALGVWLYWGIVALISLWSSNWAVAGTLFTLALLLPLAAMVVRTRSLKLGLFSVLLWHLNAIGLAFGLLRSRASPVNPIRSRILRTASGKVHGTLEFRS